MGGCSFICLLYIIFLDFARLREISSAGRGWRDNKPYRKFPGTRPGSIVIVWNGGLPNEYTNLRNKKCFDTKKAERYFKERNIKYQLIDLKEKGMSKGEYTSVKQAVGGLDVMLNDDCKDKDALALIKYIAAEDRDEKVLENQKVLKSPIVRNGKKATIGYQPEVWKTWD